MSKTRMTSGSAKLLLGSGFLTVILFFLPTLAFADGTVVFSSTGTNAKQFGFTVGVGVQDYGQSFTEATSYDITSVDLWLETVGSPTDNVVVSLQADAGGSPSGTDLTSGSISHSSLSGSFAQYTVSFSTPYTTTGGNTYWIVIKRDGSLDNTNYYKLYGDGGANNYANGTIAYLDAGVWNTQGEDLRGDFNWITAPAGGSATYGRGAFDYIFGLATSTSSSTVSIIDNPNQDFFNGTIIMFISMFGVMWIFRRLKQ